MKSTNVRLISGYSPADHTDAWVMFFIIPKRSRSLMLHHVSSRLVNETQERRTESSVPAVRQGRIWPSIKKKRELLLFFILLGNKRAVVL